MPGSEISKIDEMLGGESDKLVNAVASLMVLSINFGGVEEVVNGPNSRDERETAHSDCGEKD